jgi:hypothetical protein
VDLDLVGVDQNGPVQRLDGAVQISEIPAQACLLQPRGIVALVREGRLPEFVGGAAPVPDVLLELAELPGGPVRSPELGEQLTGRLQMGDRRLGRALLCQEPGQDHVGREVVGVVHQVALQALPRGLGAQVARPYGAEGFAEAVLHE